MHGPVYRKPHHSVNAPNNSVEWLLRHQSKILARVVRDEASPLWRVAWPDIGLSPTANLSRCMDAAQQWAERSFLTTEHRKNGAARSLKSLHNFSWSASLVRLNGRGVGMTTRPRKSGNPLSGDTGEVTS
jgi:hypothetical protein